MKAIIKNSKRYKLVKYPRGLNLEDFETIRRTGSVGVSTEMFGEKWFVTPQGKALFKDYIIGYNEVRIINELLYDELAKQIGLPVAQYLPASFDQKNPKKNKDEIIYGLATIDLTKRNENIIAGKQLLDYKLYRPNTFEKYLVAIDRFELTTGYKVNKKDISNTLFKMMILDALTFMEDRHANNVSFIQNDVDKYLTISPVIDNEMCFGGRYLWIYEMLRSNVKLNKFIEKHGAEMKMFVNETDSSADNKNKYVENVKQIVKLAKKNPSTSKYLDTALKKFNIDLALSNVKKMGYEISPEYEKFVRELAGLSKNIFENYIKIYDHNKQKNCKEEVL